MAGNGSITWTDAIDSKIRELRDQRVPWDEVAEIVGITREIVRDHAHDALGMPKKPRAAAVRRRG